MKGKHFLLLLIVVLLLALTLSACATPPEDTPPDDPGIVDDPTADQETREWWQMVDVDWEEQAVALDTGINMTYMVSGPEDGIPIILIHGATDSRLSWAQIVPALSDTYRVYVPELRGHGKTDKPEAIDGKYTVAEHAADILAFMDTVGIAKANIVGHSLGSLITQTLAITAADRVASATLIGSTAKIEGVDWIFEGDGETFLGVAGYEEEQALPDDFIRMWTATTNEDADFGEGIYMHAAQLPYPVWSYVFGGVEGYDNLEHLGDITCPVLIIWGTNDEMMSADAQQALQDGLTNAASVQFEEIAGASHNTHWDSQAIASQIAGFIRGIAVE